MKQLKDKVAAITGAASGIGRMLAVNLAKQGCHVAISDMNAKGLEETAGIVGGGVKLTTHAVDVAKRDQVNRFADEVVREHGHVDIIINNAGVAVVGSIEEITYEDFEWLLNINLWGVIHGTKAFLPYLRKRPEGHIVNISSINSMIPFPENSPYNVSKYAVSGFTDTLMQELHGSPIGVSCVIPGGIKTNIARNTRFCKVSTDAEREKMVQLFERMAKTSPDSAARVIISGIKKNKRRIRIGADARIMDWSKRLFPVASVILMGKLSQSVK